MAEQNHISTGTRILASLCVICPFCMATRLWPNSRFAKWWEKVQRRCICCKAYNKLKRIEVKGEDVEAEQDISVNSTQSET